jgi:ribosome-associated protein
MLEIPGYPRLSERELPLAAFARHRHGALEVFLIPQWELQWSFVRSGGPGGQNVNKVASKAVLRWNLAASPSLPTDVKTRLRAQQRNRITTEGDLIVTSQRYRDQERNKRDALDKLRDMILQATIIPKPRKASKPSRASRERRLQVKRRRSDVKKTRRGTIEE